VVRRLALTRHRFTSKLYCGSQSSFYCPPPTSKGYPIAILLHGHFATRAPPPPTPLYAIHHTLLVMAISYKGQLGAHKRRKTRPVPKIGMCESTAAEAADDMQRMYVAENRDGKRKAVGGPSAQQGAEERAGSTRFRRPVVNPPFEWGWRAVGLCSPCLWWWGRLCRRRCAVGAVLALSWCGKVSLGGKLILIELRTGDPHRNTH